MRIKAYLTYGYTNHDGTPRTEGAPIVTIVDITQRRTIDYDGKEYLTTVAVYYDGQGKISESPVNFLLVIE